VLTPDAYGMYQSESSHVSYIHDILAPYYLHGSQGWQGFGSMMGSDFSLEGCVSLFSRVGAAWGAVSSCRHSVMQYNYYLEGGCHDVFYSDIAGCGGGDNLDVDPGFVGIGRITELGPGWFRDETAAWEVDRYAGYYVNPSVYGNEAPMYCLGNTEDTVYVEGDPRLSASVGDLYFIPDFRLRRDSALIDAGDPSAEWLDPDGSRCDIGPYGGPFARTPLPEIPTWPPPGFTATPCPTLTPTAAGPDPSPVRYDLVLNRGEYVSGDRFELRRSLENPGVERSVFEVLLLDVSGTYFFWPSWSEGFDGVRYDLPPGRLTSVILSFQWPSGVCGCGSGPSFYGAVFDPSTGDLAGNYDVASFVY